MMANRFKFVVGDIFGGTIDEKVAAFDSYVSYSIPDKDFGRSPNFSLEEPR
jgi:hypothetical protein